MDSKLKNQNQTEFQALQKIKERDDQYFSMM